MLQHVSASDVELSGAWLGDRVALLVWDSASWPAPLRPSADGDGMERPIVSVVLPEGNHRAALVRLRRPRRGGRIALGEGGPAFAPSALRADAVALAAALAPPARRRLLGLLLEAGCGLFRLQDSRAFRSLLVALARDLAEGEPPARPVAAGPGQWRLVRSAGPPPAGVVHLVGETRLVRLVVAAEEAVHALIEAPVPGEVLCEAAGGGWVRPIAAPETDMPQLLDRLAAGGEEGRALTRLLPAVFGGRSEDPGIAAVLRSAALLAPARPRSRARLEGAVTGAVDLAIPDPAGGLFLRGWLRDPHGLIAGYALATATGERAIAAEQVHRFRRRDPAERFRRAAHAPGEEAQGFVAYLPDAASAGPQPDLVVRLLGGASLVLTPALRTLAPAQARDAVLASVRPEAITEAMLADCLRPAAARLHAAHLAAPRDPVVRRLGRAPDPPEVSVLVPLYRNLAFLRTQLAAFATDPGWREVETIIVLDSPEQAEEVEHLLRGLSGMHGLPIVLAVPPRNLGYAAANNVGAGLARGRRLLLLNSDVVPDRPGWLGRLASALSVTGTVAAGPKLLFEDGSIQHAGLHFARDADGLWYNRHYFKGFPRGYPPAGKGREVPAVTGACLLVDRATFEAVGGLTEDYIVGDYEDSDLCLKLRARGGRIRYEPAAELWHFERRSIALSRSYRGTLASTLNRRLHAERWDAAIEALMRRFGPRETR